MLRVERGRTLQHQLGLGVDEHGAVHVDVPLEALAGAFDVVRLDLGHDRPEQPDRPAPGAVAKGFSYRNTERLVGTMR
jgi:hypothetical protein